MAQMGRPVGSMSVEEKNQVVTRNRAMRHNTVEKAKSKNRPFKWTLKQKDAHAGQKPNLEQMFTFSGGMPYLNPDVETHPDTSVKFRVNQFLVNVGAVTLFNFNRNESPSVEAICKNFMLDFTNAKIARETLWKFFNAYIINIIEIEKQFPFPYDLRLGHYEDRKESSETLRNDGVKELTELVENGKVNSEEN